MNFEIKIESTSSEHDQEKTVALTIPEHLLVI